MVRADSSLEPRRGEAPTESLFDRKQTPTGAGRHFVSYLDPDLSNATNRLQRPPAASSRHMGIPDAEEALRLRARRVHRRGTVAQTTLRRHMQTRVLPRNRPA
ncbi:MAG: hypothetical protein JWM47_1227 [Acidimicrobiales bacterium]|nr:hypothetical protein [Acidimicrobiales bacterium]